LYLYLTTKSEVGSFFLLAVAICPEQAAVVATAAVGRSTGKAPRHYPLSSPESQNFMSEGLITIRSTPLLYSNYTTLELYVPNTTLFLSLLLVVLGLELFEVRPQVSKLALGVTLSLHCAVSLFLTV
jgi:hypothetical protein